MPPEQLGAYLREFDALMREHALDGWSTATSATAACTPASTSRSTARRERFRAFLLDAAPAGRPRTAARCRASTATAGPAASCCRTCTRRRRSAPSAAVKDVFDPDDLLNPGVIVAPGPSTPTCGCRRRVRSGASWPSPTRTTAATSRAAVHRCVGVGKCRADTTATGGVMCPSYLATRDEKDSTRGRARVLQEMANGSLVDRAGGRPRLHEALDLCLSCKGCSLGLPGRRRHGHLQGRGAVPALPAPAAAGLALRARLAAAVGPARRRAPRAGQRRCCAIRPLATLAKRLGGHRPPPAAADVRAADLPAVVRGPSGPRRRRAGAALGRHVHQPLLARGGAGRGGVLEDAGYAVQLTERAGLLRADLDLHRPARRRPPAAARAASTRSDRRCGRACRSSGWSRPAPRCCAGTPPNCCPTTRAPRQVDGADADAGRAAARDRGLDAAAT